MLYIKYFTPKTGKDTKLTCAVLTVSGKINFQGCNDNDAEI